ncbi:MAG: hypothetical protein [Caudoviricetes sp.]|nr:MAG: hypothetical protein [Caudoviricetes sp.]QIG78136.1 hypothetical protein BIHU0010003c01_00017 [Bifidobacterium phage BitterVaud1]
MSRFYGAIGFARQEQTAPGVYSDTIVEKDYRGELIQNMVRWDSKDSVNDDMRISNTLSIIADPYSQNHISEMRYVVWLGKKWKITSVTVERPRLKLELGGLYQ